MRIMLTRLAVDDQAKALAFYHYVLGFVPKQDLPYGEHRWLTLTSPTEPNGVELLLEPVTHPATKDYQDAMRAEGRPVATFAVRNLAAEHDRLCTAGVVFMQAPTEQGTYLTALFDDTCGNLIQLIQQN